MAGRQVASLPEAASWSGAQIACMVNTEINQVMAVMRQNARWAVAPRYLEEELGEDPLLRDFKILRRKVFTWQDWPHVKPTDSLTPFLEVIRSEETSAPITGVALSAVYKVLSYEIFDEKTAGAAEVMHFIVDAVTGCKFEVTDPASEEVVLLKILQVLLACLKCRAGPLLSNSDVINIINTCLRVAFTKGELLQRTSCQMMQEMVRVIFARLREFEPAEDSPSQTDPAATTQHAPAAKSLESVLSGAVSEGVLSTVSTPRSVHSAASTPRSRGAIRSIADIRLGAHSKESLDGTSDDGPGLTPRALKAFEEGKSLVEVVEEETSAVKEDPSLGADSLGPSESSTLSEAMAAAGAMGSGIAAGLDAAVTAVGDAVSSAPVVTSISDVGSGPTIPAPSETADVGSGPTILAPSESIGVTSAAPQLPPPIRVRAEPSDRLGANSDRVAPPVGNGDAAQKAPAPAASVQTNPYGLPCLVEVFRFLCTLIVPEDGNDKQSLQHDSEDLSMFGLSLLSAAVEVGGGSFEKHPRILALVTDDLFRNLMQTGQSNNLLVLSLVSGMVLSLYQHLKQHLKLQMAAFFEFVVLRAAQGKFYGATYEQQEAALEILQDFCRQPSFMADMYANADCDITCSNTFEDLSNLLSKNAFPVNAPLSALHLLSLEGLLAVIQCMADRADNASTPAGNGALTTSPDYNLEDFPQFWNLKCDDWEDPAVWVEFLRRRKYVKRRLMIGADHFNRDPKKGLEFLQGVRLLPETLNPESVAFFFRMTPGLNKNLLGEYFGEPDAFNINVLECFTKQFNFTNMALDGALRTYLEAFRLPGEAQKISRVLEAFASHYYEQCPQNFAHKDAAYVLSYSVIMLNTDQHNGQVKRKMTEEEFIRNNRKINDGKDLPREMLTHLYHSIAKNEIRMSSESIAAEPGMTYSRWLNLLRRSQSTTPFLSCDPTKPLLDRDMFSVIWGPSIAAISVVFDHADDADTLQQCMDGFLAVAKISAAHHMEDVLDNLVVSLCKFTTLIGNEKPATAFGENTKARMATSAVFEIANRHGDTIRSGWRNVLDCVIRLHKLGLLPTKRESIGDGQGRLSDGQEGSSILANAAAAAAAGTQAGVGRRRSAGIFGTVSRQFQNLLSMDPGADGERSAVAEHQVAAQQRTVQMVEACKIDDLFTDSKFLHKASLLQLIKALINVSGKPHQKNISIDEEDTALFCLDLLIAVTLRNRDRILLLWPTVHDHLASIVGAAQSPSPLVEKAVLDLLRVCQRLLPYKEDLGDELLKSLQLVLRLDARVADAYAERITREMLQLVKSSVTYIRSPVLWKTVCSLLAATARHPEAAEPGFEALTFIMQDAQHITPVNFLPCMDAALAFAEGRVGGVDRSRKSLDLLASLSTNLGRWAKTLSADHSEAATSASISGAPASDAAREALDQALSSEGASTSSGGVPLSPKLTSEKEALIDLWLRLSVGLGRICLDQREDVRNDALGCLQRSLLQGEALDVRSGKVWVRVFDQIVFPTLDELLEIAHKGSAKTYRGMEGTLRRAMALLSRVFLQFLTQLASNPGFANLWVAVLNRAEGYLKSSSQRSGGRSEDGMSLAENIPELLKNMLLVMAARAILVPEAAPPAENEAPTLWSLTWQHPIFRFLDPHFQQDLFPPPKPALAPPLTEQSSSGQEKPVEESPDAPVPDAAGTSVEEAGGAPSAATIDEGREGSSLAASKDVVDGGVKAEEVDVAEGYEKVEMEMVEPGK